MTFGEKRAEKTSEPIITTADDIKSGEKGSPCLTNREAILILFIMISSFVGSWFLLLKNESYGIMIFVAVAAAIAAFFLAFERGLIRRK